MPVHPVIKNGKIIGYQWGKSGKVYRGKSGKKKAEEQGRAVYLSGYKGK